MTTTATEPATHRAFAGETAGGRGTLGHRARGVLRALEQPVDGRGLAAFRILFGALMVGASIRFVAKGWVRELYLDPGFHFTYLGFEWVRPWPAWGMYLHFAVIGLAALLLTLGAWTRIAAAVFFGAFTYAELIDKTAYLNHYYFVSLLSLLLVFLPAHTVWSLDALRRPPPPPQVRRWAYTLLRAQVAVVYVFAGIAKLNADWMLRAQPLRTWLQAHTDLPLVGSLMGEPVVAFAASWAGAAFDLSIVGLLLWPRTRRWAFAAAVAFHTLVWLLFPIGVFSWVMLVAATVFFQPDWPRRALPWLGAAAPRPLLSSGAGRLRSWGLGLAGAYLAVQFLFPLRSLLYPGAVDWTEEGFRFAWRVMLVEKSGQVEFEVLTSHPARRFHVFPRQELTPLQYKMMSTQPDMIHQYALHLARRYQQQGHRGVRVHAHAWSALNGRPSQRLIDPEVDLAAEERRLGPKRWIVPLEESPGQPSPPAPALAPPDPGTRRAAG